MSATPRTDAVVNQTGPAHLLNAKPFLVLCVSMEHELTALRAENEALRSALTQLIALHAEAVFVCGSDNEERAFAAISAGEAALAKRTP